MGHWEFEHSAETKAEPADGGTRITHKATLDGPLSFIWNPFVGRIIKRGLPSGVERLAELAPQGASVPGTG